MARRFSNRTVTRTKRGNVWFITDVTAVNVPAATKVLLASFNAAALALRPFTIIRTHLTVQWDSDQQVATESPVGAVGEIIVSDQAVGIGATAIPDPISQADAPWFVWQGLITHFDFGSAVGFSRMGNQYIIDSKAMRTVGNNEDKAIVATNTSGVGGDITIIGRRLVKLL